MKTTLSIILTLLLASFVHAQDLGKVNPAVQQQIGTALTKYYSLKNALVASNVGNAQQSAGDLGTALGAIDGSKMTKVQKAAWDKISGALKTDAQHINKSGELDHQRNHFIALSSNMYSLVFGFKANKTDAYLEYCPMKKASWLSESKDIKNPYYGGEMLDCGSVKSTLKKNK